MARFYRKTGFWALIFIALIVGYFVLRALLQAPEVKVAGVERKDVEITVTPTSIGTLKAETEIKVTAQRMARVRRLPVEEGHWVSAGQMIAELDSEEASLMVDNARAELARAKAVLEELELSYEPMRIEVESSIRQAGANLNEAEKKFQRLSELFQKGLVSSSEYDAALRDYDVKKAAREAALSGRQRLEASARKISAQRAAVKEAEAALGLAELDYRYSFVKSPVAGVVASRPAKVGDTLPKGGLIAEVIRMDSLYIEAFIDEVDVGRVSVGQAARIMMDAYPEAVFMGEVYMISPLVKGKEREAKTFEVRVRPLPGEEKRADIVFKPGMSADVEIVVDSLKGVLVVPYQSVFEREGERFLYVVEGRRTRLKKVQTGTSSLEYFEILSGVKEAQKVILTTDAPGLADGARVKVSR